MVREAGTTAQAHRFLAGVAAGELSGTLALHEGGRWDPLTVVATADATATAGCCGATSSTSSGPPTSTRWWWRPAARPAPSACSSCRPPSFTFKRTTSLDATRSLANVELNGVWVPEARLLGEPDVDAGKALASALSVATVALALDGLGVCAAVRR